VFSNVNDPLKLPAVVGFVPYVIVVVLPVVTTSGGALVVGSVVKFVDPVTVIVALAADAIISAVAPATPRRSLRMKNLPP
jgi:hypothetical protein